MGNSKITTIQEEIKHYFGFLFDMGYNFHHFKELPMGDWEVVLESVENMIVIFSDHSEINLAFAPKDSDIENQMGIKAMIYYLTNGRVFVGEYPKNLFNNRRKRFEQLANLLKEYINQIRPFFGKDFDKYKHELILARRKYNNISIDKFIISNK
jgi:hypothetical protein